MLFLDSGAFSAFTRNQTIDIDEYIRFIKENQDIITVYANLDVIGSAEKSWENQRYMESKGLKPLPVFHVEDDFKYLDMCMEYEYFCVGGMAKASTQQRLFFLDKVWSRICDTPDRIPRHKVHGFGMTAFTLMYRYPWYSVDSTAWIQAAAFGRIFVPKLNPDGCYDFLEPPLQVAVSDKNPGRNEEGKHIDTLTELEREMVHKILEDFNIDIQKVRETFWERRRINAWVFTKVAQNLTWKRPFKKVSLGFNL